MEKEFNKQDWQDVKTTAEIAIKNSYKTIFFNELILSLANDNLKKFK